MNETWAHISDLAFEAALAGYVVALVCYAIEFAARRGGDVPADQASIATAGGAAGRHLHPDQDRWHGIGEVRRYRADRRPARQAGRAVG
jgi:hypothetical protein